MDDFGEELFFVERRDVERELSVLVEEPDASDTISPVVVGFRRADASPIRRNTSVPTHFFLIRAANAARAASCFGDGGGAFRFGFFTRGRFLFSHFSLATSVIAPSR